MTHRLDGVENLLAYRNVVLVDRHVKLGRTLKQRKQNHQGHHQSFTPAAEAPCIRRCCSSRVSRSRRSIELRICSAWLWLNPLLGSRDYQPLTQGMQAALPFVDDFLPVHNLASLADLATALQSAPLARR